MICNSKALRDQIEILKAINKIIKIPNLMKNI